MKQFTTLENRSSIVPPTQAEFAEAARRGQVLTGELLMQLRARPSLKANAPGSPTSAQVKPSGPDVPVVKPLDARIELLKRQNDALSNENTRLKVRVLTGT